MLTIFVCNDMEAAWIAQVCADSERQMEQWERDEDRDHEEQLARECVADDETGAWPWYAEPPFEVEEPEVVDAAVWLDVPPIGGEVDEDDETPVEFYEDDYEPEDPRWL